MTDEANESISPERFNGLMGTMNQRTRERDAAQAEVERLRAELASYRPGATEDDAPVRPSEQPESNDEQEAPPTEYPVHVVTDPIYAAMKQKSDLVDANGIMMVPAHVAREWAADSTPGDPVAQAKADLQRASIEYMESLRENDLL